MSDEAGGIPAYDTAGPDGAQGAGTSGGPEREYPLTPVQERMWFLQRLDPDDTSENLATVRRVTGGLDVAALRRAVDTVVARHEPLRASFHEVEGAPVQRVAARARVPVELHDLRGAADPRGEAERAAVRRGAEPYRMDRGPLLRVALYRTAEDACVLLLGAHHLVSDGWSIQLLLDELTAVHTAAVAGREAELPPLKGSFGDHVMWQRARATGPAADRALAYWTAELAAPPGPGLPFAPAPGPGGRTADAEPVRSRIPAAAAAAVEGLARAHGCTPFMAWLALYQVLVARHTGQRDIVVGAPTAGRERVEDEALAGCFTAVLPLRADLGDEVTFATLLERTRETVTGALTHPQVPYEQLLGALGTARDGDQRQLFRTWFNLHTEAALGRTGTDQAAGPVLEPVPGDPPPSPYDLSLDAWPSADGLDLVLTFDPAVLDGATARTVLDRLPLLAEAAVREPHLPVAELPLLAPGERGSLLFGPPLENAALTGGTTADTTSGATTAGPTAGPATGPTTDRNAGPEAAASEATVGATPAGPTADATTRPELATVVALLVRQAELTPDAPAVEDGARVLTYRQLLAAARAVAGQVTRLGVRPGTPVGLCGGRSAETVAGMLGVLLAGHAYLPLDPALPPDRLRDMPAAAGATAVLAESGAEPADRSVPVAVLPPAGAADAAEDGELPPGPAPDALAYVLYTSGSTGEPKAVAVPHRALAARVEWMRTAYRLAPGDRVLQFAALGFDTHVEEIFPALTAGATVVLLPVPSAELPDWLGGPAGRTVTVLDLPTAYWQELVDAGPAVSWPPALRTVVLGGDQTRSAGVAAWRKRFGDRVELWNTYGPTEATVIATATRLGPADALTRPGIGLPLSGTGAYVLDPARRPVPSGVPGELWLSGAGLADGYLGRPELTGERFAADPYGPSGGRMYATGDLARVRPDGTLEFLGRGDRQIKVRGHRVEPAEVEAALLRHPGVAQAVVDLHDDAGRQSLTAWVVRRPAPAEPGRTDTVNPGRVEPAEPGPAVPVPAQPDRTDSVAPSPAEADPAAPDPAAPDRAELLRHLRRLLPAHLVPDSCVFLDRLPLTVRGKVDRAALPAPGAEGSADTAGVPYTAPRTDAEHLVAEAWADVLGLTRVGAYDDFFALGGHSLLATRVLARLRSALGIDLPVRILFGATTVEGTAAAVEELLLAEIEALSDAEVETLIEEGTPAG